MIEPGERVLVAVSGGKDSLGLWDAPARARLRGRRPLRRPRHRRVLRRVGRVRARLRDERGWQLLEIDLRADVRLRRARSGSRRDPARAVRRAGCRSVTCSTTPRSSTATTSSRPATTSTTRPRCCSATCCAGRPGYLGRQHPVLPAAPGLRAQGEAARAPRRARDSRRTACSTASTTQSRSARWPRATATSGYKEVLNALEERSPGTKAAFLFGFLERGHDRFAERRGRRARRPRARARSAARRRPARCARSAGCAPVRRGRRIPVDARSRE